MNDLAPCSVVSVNFEFVGHKTIAIDQTGFYKLAKFYKPAETCFFSSRLAYMDDFRSKDRTAII